MEKILIIGASGMVGVGLTQELRKKYGGENVIASDIKDENPLLSGTGPFLKLNATDKSAIADVVDKEKINTIYHLAALLSVGGEANPELCWDLNVGSLRGILDLGVEKNLKIFWPSSIAAFGPTTPKKNTPQHTVLEPTTMYGVTKYAGELLCQYYKRRYGLDVRSLRYPGLLSWKSEPGPGTTEYAVEIFYGALNDGKYTAPLSENTYLPMMYLDDALRATIELMAAPKEKIKSTMAYNLSAMSFSPKEIAEEVGKHVSNFQMSYVPDARQAIADSWPQSIDDSEARADWGWKHEFDLPKMVEDMFKNLKIKLGK
ncbi:MAG: NAD-dependent epimerase/dehydratase family protein [Candidatus Paceibacterota bacterium]